MFEGKQHIRACKLLWDTDTNETCGIGRKFIDQA